MIKLHKPIELEVSQTYSYKFKEGDIVKIDALVVRTGCGSGIMCRVVGVWKEPIFLDLDWFYDDEDIVRQKVMNHIGV